MRAARVIITGRTEKWALAAATKLTGFATSVIACKCEAAIERWLSPDETPDARPGVAVLFFAMDSDGLGKRLTERIGQTVLTCPTASCFDGLPAAPDRLNAGRALRVFGDRLQISKVVNGTRYWRVPVMEGECLLQESFGLHKKGVAGGNFLILAESDEAALAAAEAAVAAIDGTPGVILPFPGGVVRSGSKVGARGYKGMIASTNDAYCPTVRPLTETRARRRRQRGAGDRPRRVERRGDRRRDAHGHRRGVPAGRPRDLGGQLRRQAGPVPLPFAHGDGVSDGVSLTLRAPLDQRVDAEGLTPDRCASLTEAQIAALPILVGGRAAAVGDLFDVRGGSSDRLAFDGDLSRVDGLGAGMISGELLVRGDAGDDVGRAMAGGVLRIRGNAGHRVGGPAAGASKGMLGGEIIVEGSAGDDTAARLRRGLVVIWGSTGASAGRAMIAGTLVVRGPVGDHPAEGNKRGSLIALGDIRVPASYRYACTYEPPFVRLLLTHLIRRHGLDVESRARDGHYQRFCGDAGAPGKGEILVLAGSD